MSDAYRDSPRLCPACARAMETRTVQNVVLDVCPACKGMWIDWFDGDLAQVAHDAAPLSSPSKPMPRLASAVCPDCGGELTGDVYRGVPALFRCGLCAGTFVPRDSFDALAEAAAVHEEPSALRRLIDAILHLLDHALP